MSTIAASTAPASTPATPTERTRPTGTLATLATACVALAALAAIGRADAPGVAHAATPIATPAGLVMLVPAASRDPSVPAAAEALRGSAPAEAGEPAPTF